MAAQLAYDRPRAEREAAGADPLDAASDYSPAG